MDRNGIDVQILSPWTDLLGELITHRFSLKDFAEAFETFTSRQGAALKVIVHPDQE